MRFGERLISFFRASRSACALAAIIGVLIIAFIICLAVDGSTELTGEDSAEELNLQSDGPHIPNKVNQSQLPDSSFIYDVTIEDLANADSYMDGQTVQVTGEVVGDRILSEKSGDHCWITLQALGSSDVEVVSYMTRAMSDAIDTYGAYGRHGTHLRVRGIFNLACVDHEGQSDIHADNVSVITPGTIEEPLLEPRRLIPGIALLIVGCLCLLVFNYMRERER